MYLRIHIFWKVMVCCWVSSPRYFEGPHCLYHCGLTGLDNEDTQIPRNIWKYLRYDTASHP